jgi:serine protease Do
MSLTQLSRGRWRGRLAAGAAVATLAVGGATWHSLDASAQDSAGSKVDTTEAPRVAAVASYADAVARVSPAVVTVRVEARPSFEHTGQRQDPFSNPFFRRFFGDRMPSPENMPPQRGLGSGVIISDAGRVVTNAHVVDGADRVAIVLTDQREFEAKVVGVDRATDLAVLEVEASGLPALAFGDSDQTRVGDVVLAVGNPLGVGQTVTMGIVSATGRTTSYGDGSYEDFLQTDAPINRGNSGGALVTATGDLIGINSQILSPSGGNIGIGFAIPSNMAAHVVNEIIDHGRVRRSQLGVTIQGVTSDIAQSLGLDEVKGALVSSVMPDSPAQKAGIETGDVIVSFNDRDVDSVNELRNVVAQTEPGSDATVTLLRDGAERRLTVMLTERESRAADDRTMKGEASGLGLEVTPLSPELAGRLELPDDTTGVVITGIDPNGAAASAGLREGDVITAINGRSVDSADQLRNAIETSTDRPALALVQRGNQTFFTTLPRG